MASSKEITKKLIEDGWELVRVRGSHHQYRHPTKDGLVTIPHPKKDIPQGTYNAIMKQAGLK